MASKYINSLNQEQLRNIDEILKQCKAIGITNAMSMAAMLAVVSKESGFIPQYEKDYSGTSVARIREVFAASTKGMKDAEINALKADPVKWFDFIYGGRYGNNKGTDDGYKYRGGGHNQVTFKDNYKITGNVIGVDLLNKPELINDPVVAAKAVVNYFKRRFDKGAAQVKERYGAKDINDFSNIYIAAQAFYNANAGFGKDTRNSKNDGYSKAMNRVKDLHALVVSRYDMI